MFAQMPAASAAELAAFLVSAFAVMAFVNQVLKIADRFKGHPPSSDLKGAIDSLTVRISALETQGEHQTERRREIYSKIEDVRKELKQDIKDLDGKVETLPNAIIVTLKHTGAIK